MYGYSKCTVQCRSVNVDVIVAVQDWRTRANALLNAPLRGGAVLARVCDGSEIRRVRRVCALSELCRASHENCGKRHRVEARKEGNAAHIGKPPKLNTLASLCAQVLMNWYCPSSFRIHHCNFFIVMPIMTLCSS